MRAARRRTPPPAACRVSSPAPGRGPAAAASGPGGALRSRPRRAGPGPESAVPAAGLALPGLSAAPPGGRSRGRAPGPGGGRKGVWRLAAPSAPCSPRWVPAPGGLRLSGLGRGAAVPAGRSGAAPRKPEPRPRVAAGGAQPAPAGPALGLPPPSAPSRARRAPRQEGRPCPPPRRCARGRRAARSLPRGPAVGGGCAAPAAGGSRGAGKGRPEPSTASSRRARSCGPPPG